MKTIIMLFVAVLFVSCSENPVQDNTQTFDIWINSSEFTQVSNGFYATIKNCDLITDQIYKSGSVQVYYQPENYDYYIALPQTYIQDQKATTVNYTYRIGKISILVITNEAAKPASLTGTYHLIITK